MTSPPIGAGRTGSASATRLDRTSVDAGMIAAAVLVCSDVVELSGGQMGEIATYLPGRRVTGVRVRSEEVEIHVVGRYGPTMDQIGDQIRTAVGPLVAGLPVTIGIDDLVQPAVIALQR